MFSLTENTMGVVKEILANPEAIGCEAKKLECGATVVDMGINCKGSWKAAVLFTRATMGDLGMVSLGEFKLNEEFTFSSVEMFIDQPMIACVGAEMADWRLGDGEYATIASGPARAQAVVDTDHYIHCTPYRDGCRDAAVVCLQDVRYPSEELAMEIANACHVAPENTYILVSNSTCIAASMQVSARMLEQTCHKMFEKHFDPGQMVLMRGSAPIAPVVKNEDKTFGRINDALIYGSEVQVWVDAEDDAIAEVIDKLVGKTSSPNYGELFEDIFLRAGKDFFYVDHDVHSVAKIQIHNVNTGRAFVSGEINYELLEKSFLY